MTRIRGVKEEAWNAYPQLQRRGFLNCYCYVFIVIWRDVRAVGDDELDVVKVRVKMRVTTIHGGTVTVRRARAVTIFSAPLLPLIGSLIMLEPSTPRKPMSASKQRRIMVFAMSNVAERSTQSENQKTKTFNRKRKQKASEREQPNRFGG